MSIKLQKLLNSRQSKEVRFGFRANVFIEFPQVADEKQT